MNERHPSLNEQDSKNVMDDPTTELSDILSEEQKQKAIQLVDQIDPKNHQALISYGMPVQSKLLSFSNTMLENVQKSNIDHVGTILSNLMGKLNDVNPEELNSKKSSFFARLFKKTSNSNLEIRSRYQKTAVQLDRMSIQLERSKNTLLADTIMLDRYYEHNQDNFNDLNVYIAAGDIKLEYLRTVTIPDLEKAANLSNDQVKQQEAKDLIQFADHLERRLYDLKISREITLQNAPQIRMIQKTNRMLVDKIQTSILTAIPLWKNHVSIAIALITQRRAAQTQAQVEKTTNEWIEKKSTIINNNETNKLVPIESLKETQEHLLSALEDTLKIQEEGLETRRHAEQELLSAETDLKQKLQKS
jgi:uncharacterized protein YaaN involved in tellurite resistance